MKQHRVTFFVFLILLMSAVLLSIAVQTRYQDFLLAQTVLSKQAVKSSVYEIQRYILAQRHLADLYAKVEGKEIVKLAENVNNTTQHELLSDKLHRYIPEAHNYTVADAKGHPLLPDEGKKLGKGCLRDIKAYADDSTINKVFVHSNPIPTEYHFDVLTDVNVDHRFHGIFFISINTSVLSKFLENFQLPGHQLILTRPKKGKTLIELTSKGPRPVLDRPVNLSDDELEAELYSEKIAGSYWTIRDIQQADYIQAQFLKLVMPAVVSWLFFLVISLFLLRKIIVEQGEKNHLSNELQKAHDDLQTKVELRTAALQQSESAFREVLENSKDTLYKLNLITGTYEYMSPAVNKILGITADDFISGGLDLFFTLLHPEDKDKVQKEFHTQLEHAGSYIHQETLVYRMKSQKSGYRWLSDNRCIVLDNNHQAQYLIGSVRDITDSKKQQELLSRSQKMDAIGKLTGGIAHDFNNILGIILGSVELLLIQVGEDKKVKNRVQTIQKAGLRAADLTQKLLTFSRYQPDNLRLVNINVLIEEMDNLLVRAVTPQVEIEYQLSHNLWMVNINVGDFEDMLINMVINARDAMKGKGHLTIETNNASLDKQYCLLNPDAQAGDYVELVISDNGEGIDKDMLENIFEPFFTTKEQGQGTGLGLSTVYGFIEHSGGHIKVYSEQNIGTTFRLYVPRSDESVQDTQTEPVSTLQIHGTETLLIVDDEQDLLDIASTSLTALGYKVLTANNGQQALEQLQKNPDIHLLFSDVVMPGGLNGYELAEQAVAIKPNLLVLLTSGYSKKAIARNGQARFDANMLSKPYTQSLMSQSIRDMLDEMTA